MTNIILLQENYRFLRNEVVKYQNNLSFQKEYFVSMINNLSYMNNIKIYQDSDNLFISILDELKEIKNTLEILTLENFRIKNYKNIKQKSINLNDLLIKYSNHISPENSNHILRMFVSENWDEYFNEFDINKLSFIINFFKPICIWDAEHHKDEVFFPTKNVENVNTQKKNNTITKDIIDSLLRMPKLNIKKDKSDLKISSIIINSDSTIPNFLKTINDLVELSPKKENKRQNHYSHLECIGVLGSDKIEITKNLKSQTLLEDKNGACIYMKINNKFIVIQGIFKDDLLNISHNNTFIKDKYNALKMIINNDGNIPTYFTDNYIKTISLRDITVCNTNELFDEIKKKYNDYKSIQGKPLLSLINEFLLASKYRKIDILTLLLMSHKDDQRIAFVLFDVFKSKDKKDVSTEVYKSLHYSIRELLDIIKEEVEKEENDLSSITESDIPYERRIAMLKTSEDVKLKALDKLKSMKSSFQGDSKAQNWLDGLLKLPFSIYNNNEIIEFKSLFIKKINLIDTSVKLFSDNDIDKYVKNNNELFEEWNEYKNRKKEYLKTVRNTLDNAVYGHNEAKKQLERIFAQWINGDSKGAVLGLQGPPGTGKTSLAKNGLSKCLCDESGKSRPFVFLPIGGSVNGSTLVGHNFTYVGSTWGRIADILMMSGCMNPIIFIDEVDKVSHTEHGREIISILTHLTDATQNDEFEDKFFSGIKLDLSKALIVFSFNDPDLIDPILKDRITIIETHPLTMPEKLTIIRDYMFPDICKEVGFNNNEIILTDKVITFIIETYTNEAGVRKTKEKIVEIIREINLDRFHNDDIKLPFEITKDYVKTLFINKPKVRVKKIHDKPEVGLVNGLYATSSGIGGLTPVQVLKFPSTKMLELNITGKAGDVMKESIEYSFKNAFTLLDQDLQDKIIEDANNKKSFGLHIHFPDGATPKDGPSAGLAITLAFYSMLSGIPVKNDLCMTGEIDLRGNAGIIGGLESKLIGGKKAGCKLALIPKDNLEDLEKMRREGLSPEDDNFKVIIVNDIRDVLNYALLK